MKKHGDTEKKDEGGRITDEKEETSIIVFDQFQTEFDQFHPSSFSLCLRGYFLFVSISEKVVLYLF